MLLRKQKNDHKKKFKKKRKERKKRKKLSTTARPTTAENNKRVGLFDSIHENKQESCAIAKMTAQCALCMGALKIFGTP